MDIPTIRIYQYVREVPGGLMRTVSGFNPLCGDTRRSEATKLLPCATF